MIGTVIYDLVEGKQAAPMSWSWAVVVNKMAQAVCVTPEPRRFQRSLVLTSGISHTLAQLLYILYSTVRKKSERDGSACKVAARVIRALQPKGQQQTAGADRAKSTRWVNVSYYALPLISAVATLPYSHCAEVSQIDS
jgi:hypothetical protein